MKKSQIRVYVLRSIAGAAFMVGIAGHPSCYAQEASQVSALSQRITDAKTNESTYAASQELKSLYFKDNKFSEFIDQLNSLVAKKKALAPLVNYYIGLSRYQQLKYLEEKQLWDEYFSQGNAYREQLTDSLANVIAATKPSDEINVFSRLILWRFHRDQQDAFHESALVDLMSAALEYGKTVKDGAGLKEIADTLLLYGEKAKSRELYKLYVEKIASADLKGQELEAIAEDFFAKGNLELSQLIYDLAIERILPLTPKEKMAPMLLAIAKRFSFDSDSANKDLLYAEKVFQKIEDIAGAQAFDETLMYARAFNLEKAKEYAKAKERYLALLSAYPDTVHADEARYKVAMISAYAQRDIAAAREYFDVLRKREKTSAHTLASLYQLGLFSQWENNADKAKEYYQQLLEKARDDFQEIVAQTKARLQEIAESKPIDYNLKTFLDVTFIQGYEMFDMSKVEVSASGYRLKKDEMVTIASSSYTPESGCMQVALQYLWSGNLGKAQPGLEETSFDTAYAYTGSKEINVVIVAASGIIDRSFDLVDVY